MSEATMAEQGKKRVTVVVADDHPLYREGVVRALLASGQIEIVAEAEDGRAALAAIQEHLPDVALLDYKLPELDGVAVTHAVVREQLPTRVLLVSAFTDSGVVYKALETGAAGFISKEARREQIVDAVLACARGENVVPPEVAAGLVSEIRLRKQDDAPALTPREQEILHLIAAGKSLPQIAEGALPGADDREDARPAPVREARRLRSRRRGRERDAARPDRVARWRARLVPASYGEATAESERVVAWLRLPAIALIALGQGLAHPNPEETGFLVTLGALLGVERRRARLGVPAPGRRAVRARRRPRSTSPRSACWRCSRAARSRTRGSRSSSSRWRSPSASARRSRRPRSSSRRPPTCIQAVAPPGGAAAGGGALHRHAGRVPRLGRRRLRPPLAAARPAHGAGRAPRGERSRLLADALEAEQRERKALAEALHDHAIQNLLSARHELEEAGEARSHPALDRADAALAETVGQLRDAVFDLHPYVLERGRPRGRAALDRPAGGDARAPSS